MMKTQLYKNRPARSESSDSAMIGGNDRRVVPGRDSVTRRDEQTFVRDTACMRTPSDA